MYRSSEESLRQQVRQLESSLAEIQDDRAYWKQQVQAYQTSDPDTRNRVALKLSAIFIAIVLVGVYLISTQVERLEQEKLIKKISVEVKAACREEPSSLRRARRRR